MRKEDFRNQLTAASFAALRFGQECSKACLSHNLIYVVVLNAGYCGNCENNKVIYPEDNGKIQYGLSEMEVPDLLHRDDRCPRWIDISVAGADKEVTLLCLICSECYYADESQMFYYQQGTQPFGIKSPNLPVGYETGNKFKLKKPEKAMAIIAAREESGGMAK